MKLKRLFDDMAGKRLDVDDYPDDIGDLLAFEVFLVEAFVAGIADRMICGEGGPRRSELQGLRRQYLVEGNRWAYDADPVDLADYPEILDYVRAIERVRSAILQQARIDP